MTGRLSTNLARELAKARPLTFSKAGTATAAAFGGRWYNTWGVPVKVGRIHASVGTAPTGASLKVDVKIDGTTVFAATGDQATITATNFATAIGGVVPTKTDDDDLIVLPGHYLTVEVSQIGSTVAGSDLNVQVYLV